MVIQANLITVTVPEGTDRSALVPLITLSTPSATVAPASGSPQDFRVPRQYTVTAEDGTQQVYTVTVSELSASKDIQSFELQGISGQVTMGTDTITVLVPNGTDRSQLNAMVTLSSPTATVSPVSGTILNFMQPVNYVVTAEDSSRKTYMVTVRELSSSKEIMGFSLPNVARSVVIQANLITVTVPNGTDRSALVPLITLSTPSATVAPTSGSPQDFRVPRQYTVTAEDGTQQVYTVTVSELSASKDIQTFGIQAISGQVTLGTDTITVLVPNGTDRSQLTATLTLSSPTATVSPASGTIQNFTQPVNYVVTAEDGSRKTYMVTVRELSSSKEIMGFSLPNVARSVVIQANLITVTVPNGTDRSALVPLITLSTPSATVAPASGSPQDFRVPRQYSVTAEDGTQQVYTVTVSELSVSKDIQSFELQGMSGQVTMGTDTITVLVPNGTDRSQLTATLTLSSPTATVSPASGTIQNFTQPVNYVVTAEDGSRKTYMVTVRELSGSKEIMGFSLPNVARSVVIQANLITVTVPNGTDRSALVPLITLSTHSATVAPASGSPQDFRVPRQYSVTAEDGTQQVYTVTVSELSASKDIQSFELQGMSGQVTMGTDTITVLVPNGTDRSQLNAIVTLSSPTAMILPASGTILNFMQPVNYVVTAEDGSRKTYVVTVRELSSSKEIMGFSLPNVARSVVIQANLITVTVPNGTDRSALVPLITLSSPSATAAPASGSPQDFRVPRQYTVTAEDSTQQAYTVTVSELSASKDIQSFEIQGISGQVTLGTDTITVLAPNGTDRSHLTATVTLSSPSATVTPASGALQNFMQPVNYVVTAEDGSRKTYVVTVDAAAWTPVTLTAEWNPRDGAGALSFNGKLWLLGGWSPPTGVTNQVWTSADDGATWTREADAPWPGRHCAGWVVFDNKMWVISGDGYEDVWCTSDGVNWECRTNAAPWGRRYSPYVAALGSKLYLMGGLALADTPLTGPYHSRAFNDMWESSDGINWINTMPMTNWAPRGLIQGHALIGGQLMILGGGIKASIGGSPTNETVAEYNDVWTYNGSTWARLLAKAPWYARTHLSIINYQGGIVMSDGSVGTQGNLTNEVWFSLDGIAWKEIKATPWQVRHASSLVVHNGNLLILGGYLHNDVWRFNGSLN